MNYNGIPPYNHPVNIATCYCACPLYSGPSKSSLNHFLFKEPLKYGHTVNLAMIFVAHW